MVCARQVFGCTHNAFVNCMILGFAMQENGHKIWAQGSCRFEGVGCSVLCRQDSFIKVGWHGSRSVLFGGVAQQFCLLEEQECTHSCSSSKSVYKNSKGNTSNQSASRPHMTSWKRRAWQKHRSAIQAPSRGSKTAMVVCWVPRSLGRQPQCCGVSCGNIVQVIMERGDGIGPRSLWDTCALGI